MRITIIYDNEAAVEGLKADWGFACLVEAHGARMLFDTGANGPVLLDNMKRLGIEPTMIDEVFISHDHWDHTGGLADFLHTRPVRCYVPASCAEPTGAREVVRAEAPVEIHGGVYSTGELGGFEQSLVVDTGTGIVVVAGCSHPGVGAIIEAASKRGKPRALVGGLHGFSDFALLADLEIVCATHCTQHTSRIEELYPHKCVEGGAGAAIDV
jgi:7,8-dihydropterin-6-yl-methyl-4-(beta-D-ribofuranosyl)aminobenzene 5'-phosphate synthase